MSDQSGRGPSELFFDAKRCPRSRRGPKQTPHEPHDWWAGVYLPVGDLGYEARCPGFPLTAPAREQS